MTHPCIFISCPYFTPWKIHWMKERHPLREKWSFCGRHRKRLIKKMNLFLLFFPFLTPSKYWCESSHEKKKMQQKEKKVKRSHDHRRIKYLHWNETEAEQKNEQEKVRQMTGTRDTHRDKLYTASIGLKRLPNVLLPRDSFHDSVEWWKEWENGIFVGETDLHTLLSTVFLMSKKRESTSMREQEE